MSSQLRRHSSAVPFRCTEIISGDSDSRAAAPNEKTHVALFEPIDPAAATYADIDRRYRGLLATYGDGTNPPGDERDLLAAIFAILRQRASIATDPEETRACCRTMLDILSSAILLTPDLSRYPFAGVRAQIDRLLSALPPSAPR